MPVPSLPSDSPFFQPILDNRAWPLFESGMDLDGRSGNFGERSTRCGRGASGCLLSSSHTGGQRLLPSVFLQARCREAPIRRQHASLPPGRYVRRRKGERRASTASTSLSPSTSTQPDLAHFWELTGRLPRLRPTPTVLSGRSSVSCLFWPGSCGACQRRTTRPARSRRLLTAAPRLLPRRLGRWGEGGHGPCEKAPGTLPLGHSRVFPAHPRTSPQLPPCQNTLSMRLDIPCSSRCRHACARERKPCGRDAQCRRA